MAYSINQASGWPTVIQMNTEDAGYPALGKTIDMQLGHRNECAYLYFSFQNFFISQTFHHRFLYI